MITMTTGKFNIQLKYLVGYGDGYPSTHLGRVCGIVACISGQVMLSMMVVSMM
jgi:hypothetical protein